MMLLGLPLELAELELTQAGIGYQVEYLPNLWQEDGVWRVIRQTEKDGGMNLTVTLFARLPDEEE